MLQYLNTVKFNFLIYILIYIILSKNNVLIIRAMTNPLHKTSVDHLISLVIDEILCLSRETPRIPYLSCAKSDEIVSLKEALTFSAPRSIMLSDDLAKVCLFLDMYYIYYILVENGYIYSQPLHSNHPPQGGQFFTSPKSIKAVDRF